MQNPNDFLHKFNAEHLDLLMEYIEAQRNMWKEQSKKTTDKEAKKTAYIADCIYSGIVVSINYEKRRRGGKGRV